MVRNKDVCDKLVARINQASSVKELKPILITMAKIMCYSIISPRLP